MWYINNKNTVRYTYQTKENELVFKFELAGKTKDDVKVYNKNGTLAVKVNDKHYYTADVSDELYYQQDEYNFGAAKASMLNGLLTVRVPKTQDDSCEIKIE